MNEENTIDLDELFRRMAWKDDEEAFRIIFYRFFSPLCVFSMRYIRQKETCEDIVQETFLKIWKNRQSLEIRTSSRNLLITAVKNSCIDYLRKQESEYRRQEQYNPDDDLTDSPEDIYSAAELEQILHAALAKLPDNIRTVFEMNRFEGKTYAKIAEEQNISVKTVESYMTKSLKLLRIELKDFMPLIILFMS
ncbi:MAG: RNA polymerase sigma-70 factor [Tannerella sp.]|jgi:RNA polymerase sigma-70 factor (ECF subfamily)|nr:RNA polymerase sigma-70 factor [Tannerella sp.]